MNTKERMADEIETALRNTTVDMLMGRIMTVYATGERDQPERKPGIKSQGREKEFVEDYILE